MSDVLDRPLDAIERVRMALAMAEAGYKTEVSLEEVADLLFQYDKIRTRWKPIETAPKDRTSVDLFSTSRGRLTNAFWSDVEYCQGVPWGWTNFQLGRITDATHWMPLPEAPK